MMMGKSATGKDTIYRDLMNKSELPLLPVTGYTTRPIRDGEQNGKQYYFVTVQQMKQMEQEGKIIECRCYQTVYREQKYPKYAELCRRYLADEQDFADENLDRAGIQKRYQNIEEKDCLLQIIEMIRKILIERNVSEDKL